MSTSEMNAEGFSTLGQSVTPNSSGQTPTLHRIRAVRQEQGMSLRRVAQQMKMDIEVLREEEERDTDMPLSRLYAWQKALEVPVADLLVDNDSPLSAPVLQRARMVRLMKSVAGILEKAHDPTMRRLAEGMADQLKQMMPELEGVTAWHEASDRRQPVRFGRIVQQVYSYDFHVD
jgi:transcriptional regulator with XRE-family HTH domain